jgi:hypothetical protein
MVWNWFETNIGRLSCGQADVLSMSLEFGSMSKRASHWKRKRQFWVVARQRQRSRQSVRRLRALMGEGFMALREHWVMPRLRETPEKNRHEGVV